MAGREDASPDLSGSVLNQPSVEWFEINKEFYLRRSVHCVDLASTNLVYMSVLKSGLTSIGSTTAPTMRLTGKNERNPSVGLTFPKFSYKERKKKGMPTREAVSLPPFSRPPFLTSLILVLPSSLLTLITYTVDPNSSPTNLAPYPLQPSYGTLAYPALPHLA